MEQYARNDTHHLKPLVDQLRLALEAKGRLAWHREMCDRLIADSSTLPTVDTDRVWRLKGSSGLGRPALAVLRELWHWRESEAVAANRPPFFVLSHEALVNIADAAAHQRPVDPLVPPRLSPRRREGIAAAIRTALQLPPDRYPALPERNGRRPTQAEFRRYRDLEKRRDAHAHKLGIDPTLIAPRAALGDLARDWNAHAPQLMNWQRELLK
jgi:ribonuclease D